MAVFAQSEWVIKGVAGPSQAPNLPSFLPKADGVEKGRISVAISGVDGGTLAQEVLHHIEVTFRGSNVQGGTAVIVFHAQVTTLKTKQRGSDAIKY